MSAGGFGHPDYEVFGELGRGTFGTVYRARRKGMQDCAVKVFDPGRVDLARAARELEKLQRVQEHRGVVTVYDFDLSGEAPFYAMGLHAERADDGAWRGRTLAALFGKVSEREAWRLIGDVAEALAYLHEHEVIHCDVKPGNVLLTDEKPVGVKVCDFGQSRGSAAQWGERAGTLGYAAPEQLESPGQSGEGRGYRWDVYGFGVTAFELLTGRWPRLEGWRAGSVGDVATLRESLVNASLRDGEVGGVGAEVVGRLRAEGGAVKWPGGAKVDRERCAVIERCLALDPSKRFGDMRAVAEALRAVETRRTLTRSRRVLAAVCGLAALAVVGGAGAMVQWRAADSARSQAEGLVEFMTFNLRDSLSRFGRIELLDEAVKAVDQYYERRGGVPGPEAGRRLCANFEARGDIELAKGDLKAAEEGYERARAIAEELHAREPKNSVFSVSLMSAYRKLAEVADEQGQPEKARGLIARATELAEALLATGAGSQYILSRSSEAYAHHAALLRRPEDREAARPLQLKAAELSELLFQKNPGDPDVIAVRVRGLMAKATAELETPHWSRWLQEAEGLIERSEARYPDDRWIIELRAECAQKWGSILEWTGQYGRALAKHGEAISLFDRLWRRSPADRSLARKLCDARDDRAYVSKNQKDYKAAAQDHRAIESTCREILARFPDHPVWLNRMAGALLRMAEMAHSDQRDFETAAKSYRESMAIYERLMATNPEDRDSLYNIATIHHRLANVRLDQGMLDAAVSHGEECVRLMDRWDSRRGSRMHGFCLLSLGNALQQRGDLEGGAARIKDAVSIFERIASPIYKEQQDLTFGLRHYSEALEKLGRIEEAEAQARRRVPILEGIARGDPGVARFQVDYALALTRVGGFRKRRSDFEGASELYERASEHLAQCVERNPDEPLLGSSLANVLWEHAALVTGAGNGGRQEEMRGRATAALVRAIADERLPDGLAMQGLNVFQDRGRQLASQGRGPEAEAFYVATVPRAMRLLDGGGGTDQARSKLSTYPHRYGRLLSAQGRSEEARPCLEMAVRCREGLCRNETKNTGFLIDCAAAYADLWVVAEPGGGAGRRQELAKRMAEAASGLEQAIPAMQEKGDAKMAAEASAALNSIRACLQSPASSR